LAGAVALARRARLLELRITYDLAFDRIIHYGHLIVFEGPTKRMEASPMANKR
jgi:hypothetical protein